jgi:hypothetical protein
MGIVREVPNAWYNKTKRKNESPLIFTMNKNTPSVFSAVSRL